MAEVQEQTAPAQGLEALAALSSNPVEAPIERVQQLDKYGRAYATGKRKNAVARVWVKPGSGKWIINGREQEVYFARPVLRMMIAQPLNLTDRASQFDVVFRRERDRLHNE